MSDALTRPPQAGDMAEMMRRRGLSERVLTVTASTRITPRMQRVTVTASGEGAFDPLPGQDMVMLLPDAEGNLGRRHYTIRRYDAATGTIEIDIVLHGETSPGPRWALEATPGTTATAYGPRSNTRLHPGAEWRLFIGDETCVPGILAMIEALPADAKASAIIEIEDDGERQPIDMPDGVTIEWLPRNGPAVAGSEQLIQRVADFDPPPGIGHIHLIGETSTVQTQRRALIARGFPAAQIFAEGYWRPDRLGGHDHIK